jgi:4-amino-4-deoxy-L-arabinose transferase-like glycosyltransferase
MPRRFWTVVAPCAGLLGLCCLVQALVIGRAVVTGLDTARFAARAQQLDADGWIATVRTHQEPPLYWAEIWAVHKVLLGLCGNDPEIWARAAQYAAAIPLVLTMMPLFLLSQRLFGTAAAVAAGVLFCFLPEASRLGGDGICDSTHLLFFTIAFWAVVVFFSGRGRGAMADYWDAQVRTAGGESLSPHAPHSVPDTRWLLLAGLATGMAILARVEAVVMPIALAITFVLLQFQRARRRPLAAIGAAMGLYLLGLALILTPYLCSAGALAPRAAITRILGRPAGEPHVPLRPPLDNSAASIWQLPDGQMMSFVAEDPTANLRRHGLGAVQKFLRELTIVFWYWLGVLALAGLARVWPRPGNTVDWFVRVFLGCYVALALGFAVSEGYITSRHLLPLAVVGIGCSGFGAMVLGQMLAGRFASLGGMPSRCEVGGMPSRREASGWHVSAGDSPAGALSPGIVYAGGAAVVLLAALACCPQTFKPLSPVGLGHRAAARWLATEAEVPGTVLDTQGLMGLYSGRASHFYAAGPAGFADPCLAYVVLERHELGRPSSRSRTLQQLLDIAGELVRTFPGPGGERLNHDVLVYRWHPERLLRRASALVAALHGGPAPLAAQER